MDVRQTAGRAADQLSSGLGFDVRFYGKSFALLSAAQVSAVIRGLATTYLMTRWLTKDAFGQFRYVLAVFGIAGIFSLVGLNAGVIRGVAQGEPAVAWAALKRILIISPLGSLLLLAGAAERQWHGEPTVALALAFAAVAFPFYAAAGLYGPIMTGREEVTRLAKTSIFVNTLFSILFAFVIFSSRALLPVLAAYFIFDILLRGALTWRELRRIPRQGDTREHMRLGEHLSGIGVMQALAAQLDQILIPWVAGYGTLANYAVASLLPEQIKDFVNSIGGIMLRRFARQPENEKTLRATRKHFWTMFSLSAAVTSAYALATPWLLPRLFPAYAEEIWPSIVYCLGLLAMPALVGLNYFQAHGRIRELWRFSIVGSAMQIGLNLLLIPVFGRWGAVWSKTATRLANLPFAYPRGRSNDSENSLNPTVSRTM